MKMDDLGVPLFLETPIYVYIYNNHQNARAFAKKKDATKFLSSKLQLKKLKSGLVTLFFLARQKTLCSGQIIIFHQPKFP